jgi:hypothetical protein
MKRIRRPFLTLVAGGLAIALAACAGDSITAPQAAPSFNRAAAGAPAATSPSLLACPSNRSLSASAVIGRRGGTVSVGHFSMWVPPGAVRTPTRFTFEVPASQYLEVEIHAAGVAHYQFRHPVRVTLDYSRCGRDFQASTLDAWYIDSSTKALLTPMRGAHNRGKHSLVFWTDHLSGYALAE